MHHRRQIRSFRNRAHVRFALDVVLAPEYSSAPCTLQRDNT